MNERLTILKQHAGVDYNPDQEGLNLFAELIIRECVGILEPKSRYMGEGPEVLKDKIRQIKQHFGVEE